MLIDRQLLDELGERARGCERLRMNYDLRTSPDDGSQRMLNALEPGTSIPVHRHTQSTETVVCIEGCIEEVFYEELPNMDAGGMIHDGERALDESCFVEVARYRICPREKVYGIQVPVMAWHRLVALEPSVIFEAKDGKYKSSRN